MAIYFNPATTNITTRTASFDQPCNYSLIVNDPDYYVSIGTGQSATGVQGTQGNYYEIASGTTANAETILLLKRPLKLGSRIQIQCDRSVGAGVANTSTFFELVEVDPALLQSSPATCVITEGTSAQVKNARNAYQIAWINSTAPQIWNRYAGSTAIQNQQQNPITSASVTTSRGSSPNFRPAMHYALKFGNEGIIGTALNLINLSTGNAPAGTSATSSSFRDSVSAYSGIDVSKTYALRIRVVNGSSAPASSVITRLYRVIVTNDNALAVDPLAAATTPYGSESPASNTTQPYALPVLVTQGATNLSCAIVTMPEVTSRNYAFYNTTAGITESVSPLTANATFTSGAVNFLNSTAGLVRLAVVSDQPSATDGVLIEVSNNAGTNWRAIAKGTTIADTPLILSAPLIPTTNTTNFFRQHRVRYINGANAQANFSLAFFGGVLV